MPHRLLGYFRVKIVFGRFVKRQIGCALSLYILVPALRSC